MTQYGFFIDLSRCIGCNACLISCKQWHDVPPGPVKWLRVYQWEKGSFPAVDLRVLPMMCMHCEKPVCADACPNQAIYKDERFGAVLVDPEKCKGERKCWEACPYGAPQYASDAKNEKMTKCTMCIDRLEQGLKPICVLSCSMRALEFGPIDELRLKYENQGEEEPPPADYPPCRNACPAGIDAGGYVEYLAAGKISQALEIIRETTPFAGVLGRVCSHPCESDCRRGKFDDAVPICALKRFAADYGHRTSRKKVKPLPVVHQEKVAVIGSGPAGLSCAYDLVRQGYAVTVFESASRSGGVLRYGIPAYRLPKDVLDAEIDYITKSGVEIRTDSPVARASDVFIAGYRAVFIAAGAGQSQKLNVPGEEYAGIYYALDFLKKVNSGEKVSLGKRVVVVGGGSVAVDAARVARRLGDGEVDLVCLECRDLASRDRMPALDDEIIEAEAEGVVIHPGLGVSRIANRNGSAAGLETLGCIAVYDRNGRFNPQYSDEAGPTLAADTIIVAIGQRGSQPVLDEPALECNRNGSIKVDPATLETSLPGVFAGGDVVPGTASVVTAIAMGKEAAVSIGRYLKGEDLHQDRQPPAPKTVARPGYLSCPVPLVDVRRRRGFAEVNRGLSKQAALEQAERCVRCKSTQPSVIFWPVDRKRQIVPYDAGRALELWQKRHADSGEPLPDIFKDVKEITRDPADITGRNKLVLKPRNVEELMFYTVDDE